MTSCAELYLSFKRDCEQLINSFINHRTPNFKRFCTEWKRSQFQYIYHGHHSHLEVIEFVEESLNVIKHLFLNALNVMEKIGYFYLLYTFYFKQPAKEYCKIRLTLPEWIELKGFYDLLSNGDHLHSTAYNQARLIFWKLITNDALRFVQNEFEVGLEKFMTKQQPMDSDNNAMAFSAINKNVLTKLHVITNEETGILPAIELLECGYNEMKEIFNSGELTSSNNNTITPASHTSTSKTAPIEQLPVTEILKSLRNDIECIETYFKKRTHNHNKKSTQALATNNDDKSKNQQSKIKSDSQMKSPPDDMDIDGDGDEDDDDDHDDDDDNSFKDIGNKRAEIKKRAMHGINAITKPKTKVFHHRNNVSTTIENPTTKKRLDKNKLLIVYNEKEKVVHVQKPKHIRDRKPILSLSSKQLVYSDECERELQQNHNQEPSNTKVDGGETTKDDNDVDVDVGECMKKVAVINEKADDGDDGRTSSSSSPAIRRSKRSSVIRLYKYDHSLSNKKNLSTVVKNPVNTNEMPSID